MGNTPITVLMATCNGATYLEQQLHSITAQTRQPAQMIVSDDGSTDDTPYILRHFTGNAPFPVTVNNGPQKGIAQNMLALQTCPPNGYVAFADQDDVWLPDKLARAMDALSQSPTNHPALYTSRRIITDAQLNPLGLTKLPHRGPGFANALVQNIAPGNTIVLNPAALTLARSAACDLKTCIPYFHDWWLYQLVTGAEGKVFFDPDPTVYYRQHKGNYLGAGNGIVKKTARLKALFDGTYRNWLLEQALALECSSDRLTRESRNQLTLFLQILQGTPDVRRPVQIYRQSIPEQLLLKLSMALYRLNSPLPRYIKL